MLPALSPSSYSLINGRTLSMTFDPFEGIAVSLMLGSAGDFIYMHVMHRTDNGWETVVLV